ncbi:ABC transporter ATP-binding protein [Plastoroseomonas hellenica]|uniref:ABC transporter ATP-binding protein n=1 Tax=Plastoroseomonas hellenica TaxID=2687306 RepID=UPI001BA9D220|nr:oligopeptide/dipeptide ABC transporter ATP-binding protein [Plastoroseomonas hellenica]MBR0647303.1 ATP-binding cassette domain-containing protein [Plastoroseomonas hellenica]
MSALLEVDSLSKRYPVTRRGLFRTRQYSEIRAVDNVSFRIEAGETLGLVGESGCGKTTTARAILNLVEPSEGVVRFQGRDIVPLFKENDRTKVLQVRRSLQYVFQDPWLSLNPRWTIGETLKEPLRVHRPEAPETWGARVEELLRMVGLEPHHAWRYPHEFSGGQRQRVGIARALAIEPRLVILDEPVSSLDVSVRAQILNLLVELQDRLGLTYLYISHDLSSVRFISTHVAVMYLGKLVEIGQVDALFTRPRHHYTRALLSAIPMPQPGAANTRIVLQGEVPSALRRPSGCPFHPRCAAALPVCAEREPLLTAAGDDHRMACHNPT